MNVGNALHYIALRPLLREQIPIMILQATRSLGPLYGRRPNNVHPAGVGAGRVLDVLWRVSRVSQWITPKSWAADINVEDTLQKRTLGR